MTKDTLPTKILNGDGTIPTKFYVFTNMLNPITWHNVRFTRGIASGAIGEVVANKSLTQKYLNGTLDYIQFVPNQKADINSLSMYTLNSTSAYRIEYNCEIYRRYHDETKLYPSRMSCLYAFGDYETCEAVARKHGPSWDLDSVREYKLLPLALTRAIKVNMEVISLFRVLEPIGSWSPEEQEKIWHHYWSGRGNLKLEYPTIEGKRKKESSGVIWEYLIEGRLELLG